MTAITSVETFKKELASLPLTEQRLVGAKFVLNVLDLVEDTRIGDAQAVAGDPNASAEELQRAYRVAHSAYVENHPRSDLAELDWRKQAAHFVAEACMVCLAPAYSEARMHHVAEKAATYCQMARICSSVGHEGEYPSFAAADDAVKKEINAQYQIVADFLAQR
jgi:hypothetical protein